MIDPSRKLALYICITGISKKPIAGRFGDEYVAAIN
jgi:hypothetical protein